MDVKHIGRQLVNRHLLTEDELAKVLTAQAPVGGGYKDVAVKEREPLSDEQLWGLLADAVIHHCPRVNLTKEDYDPASLSMVDVHDAWDHLVLPLWMDEGELLCATTEETAATALAMLHRTLEVPYRLVISEIRLLEQFIAERYAYEGVDVEDE